MTRKNLKNFIQGDECLAAELRDQFRGSIDKSKKILLWEMIISGKIEYDLVKSGVEIVNICEGCGRVSYNYEYDSPKILILDEQTWDGSDFCIGGSPRGSIIVTKRVKDLLSKNKVTNLKFVREHSNS